MTFFQVDGKLDLHYKLIGEGSTKVLFITGIQTTMGSWRKQMEYFASQPAYECCYVDNRGVGLSSAPVGTYSYGSVLQKRLSLTNSTSQMANDTLALVNNLHWTSYHLVGLSMGGMIALELALIDYHRIQSLTLMVTHAGGPSAYVPLPGVLTLLSFPYQAYHDPVVYSKWIMPLLYSKKWRKEKYIDNDGNETEKTNEDICLMEMLELRKNNPANFAGLIGQTAAVATHWVSYKSLKSLRNRGIPTMILTASRDKLVRPENSYLLSKKFLSGLNSWRETHVLRDVVDEVMNPESNFSAGLRVTVLNDFLKPEETCTKPSFVYQKKLSAEDEDGKMVIEYEGVQEEPIPTTIAKITLADCLACSGCITSSEVIFLESQSTLQFRNNLSNNDISNPKTFVLSMNQQSLASLSVHYNLSPVVTFAKIGVQYIFSLSAMRDLSFFEVAKEFIERKKKAAEGDKKALPMLLGYCPGWVCYAEKAGDQSIIDLISTTKSPQQLMGSFLKSTFAKEKNISPSMIYHASIGQCYDKKLEAVRDDIANPNANINSEVDIVLTTTELVQLIENEYKINFLELPEYYEEGILNNFSRITESGFGPSHGYTDITLKLAAKDLWGCDVSINNIIFKKGKNSEIWETEFFVDGVSVLSMCRAYGFRNIQNVIRMVKRGACKYDFIELLACPGGCSNGGGQIKSLPNQNGKQLLQDVNNKYNDSSIAIVDPLLNPFVSEDNETRRKQLHTEYHLLPQDNSTSLSASKIDW